MYKIIKNKRAQEEIVGFAVIVVIVAVIILFFLVFSLSSDRETEESYEIQSFLQAATAYTSNCGDKSEFLPVSKLIAVCYREERCNNEEYSCDVLNETLVGLIAESWPIGPDFPTKGYKLEAIAPDKTIISISSGNATNVYKGASQVLPVAEEALVVYFTIYY